MAPSSRTMGIISLLTESVLMGMYAVLVGLVAWTWKKSYRSMPAIHHVLFGASIVMFCIAATHLGLVTQAKTVSGKAPLANAQAQIVLSAIQFIIGDLILIWRVWVIWGRSYWIAAGPFLMMLVAAGFTINIAFSPIVRTFFTVTPVALIVANTSICTLLIAGRIWYMCYQVTKLAKKAGILVRVKSNDSQGGVALIIESGALYTACQLISLILSKTQSNGLTIILNLEMPLIGILPTLIIVLVHFDMVPGSQVSNDYAATASMQFGTRSQLTVAQEKSEKTAVAVDNV